MSAIATEHLSAKMGARRSETAEPCPRRWTRADYYRMAEVGLLGWDERTELLDGEVFVMSPVGPSHYAAVRAVAETLEAVFGPGFDVREQSSIVLSDASEPEPDIAVVAGTWRDFADHHPQAAEVCLLVEISDSTLRFDQGRKARSYAREGISDYWVVNLVDRRLEVRREPTFQGYQTEMLLTLEDTITPLAASLPVRVADLFPPRL